MLDILATASPLICVGALTGIYIDSAPAVLLVQTILTVILLLAAGVGRLIGRHTEYRDY